METKTMTEDSRQLVGPLLWRSASPRTDANDVDECADFESKDFFVGLTSSHQKMTILFGPLALIELTE